ncbi:hypothetical protein FRB99_000568 [Tulasnella sp. 403]|nr:hypothetical protein FRB99_000568 [Tulasnella sp. 403]
MPVKRKSDTDDKENVAVKRNRVEKDNEDEVEPSTSKGKGKSKAAKPVYSSLHDVILEGEEEGDVPVYDDCNTIRRKIRAIQKTPGFKTTHWLREIGDVNSNSLNQFMKQKGPNGGAGNITYRHAYVYFEKLRIFEGKKKTPTRIENEMTHPNGFELRTRTHQWVIGPASWGRY